MLPLRYREPTARIVASFFKDTFACQGAACPQHIPRNFVQRVGDLDESVGLSAAQNGKKSIRRNLDCRIAALFLFLSAAPKHVPMKKNKMTQVRGREDCRAQRRPRRRRQSRGARTRHSAPRQQRGIGRRRARAFSLRRTWTQHKRNMEPKVPLKMGAKNTIVNGTNISYIIALT